MSVPEEVKIELGSPLWIPKKRTTVLAAIVATISSFCLGNVLGWTAPALAYIKENKIFGELSHTQTGYIASFAILGALLSAPFTGYSMRAIGRKPTMLVIAIPFAIGWAMMAWAINLPMMYVGRFITGEKFWNFGCNFYILNYAPLTAFFDFVKDVFWISK